jgi:hypothetical protein
MRLLIDGDGLTIVLSWWSIGAMLAIWAFFRFVWQEPEDMRP